VNAASFGWQAEASRAQLAFASGAEAPVAAGAPLFDAVIVRVGGPRDWMPPAAEAWVIELESPRSGFAPLPGRYAAPDGSRLLVFVARPVAG
jgi:hypothetical protein